MPLSPDQKEQLQNNPAKTIAEVRFGESHYLVREVDGKDIAFAYIDPRRQGVKYVEETKDLTEENKITFKDVESGYLTLAQIGQQRPIVERKERSKPPVDELTVILPGTDATNAKPQQIRITEKELHDLFLKPAGAQDKKASFITLDTASHELIGITLKREHPVLAVIQPAADGVQRSSKSGLKTLLEQLYTELSDYRPGIADVVDKKIWEELGPTGAVIFGAKPTDAGQIRQREIQTYLYRIKTLLLAVRAEGSGKGLQDEELLALAPFLKAEDKSNGGGIFARLKQQSPGRPVVFMDNKIWEDIISEPDGSLLMDPKPQIQQSQRPVSPAPRPSQSESPARPLRHAQGVPPVQPKPVFERPAPAYIPPTQLPNPDRVRNRPVQPVQQPTIPQRPVESQPERPLTEKQQAIRLAKELNIGLSESMQLLQDIELSAIGKVQIDELHESFEKLTEKAEAYMIERRRGKLPENPVLPALTAKPNSINVAGVRDDIAYNYLTGDTPANFRQKIDAVFSAWDATVRPLFLETNSRSERQLSELRTNAALKQKLPDSVNKMTRELINVLRIVDQTSEDINAAEVTHALLAHQVLYALQEQYHQLKANGQAVEIDNWAGYSASVLNRFRKLIPNVMEAKKSKQK
jgi:hypothetical protein